jgi:RNA-dependent RNA polymerase
MTKWASRFSLGLSTSVPGLRLQPSDIIKVDDIGMLLILFSYSEALLIVHPVSPPPDNSEMTDGCGLINKSALLSLRLKYDWATFPTAIQVRLGGAKVGLGILTIFTPADSRSGSSGFDP